MTQYLILLTLMSINTSTNIVYKFRFTLHNINKTNSTFCGVHGCQAILDTSTNTIGVPSKYVVLINNLIEATKYLYNRYAVIIILIILFLWESYTTSL